MKRYCFIILCVILLFNIGLTAYSKWNIAIERFNSYRGTIGGQKIRMLLYPADNAKIVGNYYYVDQLKKIKLSGIIMTDSIWIYEYNEQGDQKGRFEGIIDGERGKFYGVWHGNDGGEKNFNLELIAVFAGHPDNISK